MNVPTYKAAIYFERDNSAAPEYIETENLAAFRERLLDYQEDRDVVASIQVFYKGQLLGRYSMSRIVEAIKNPSELELTLTTGVPAWEVK